jgi:cell division septation protein DedD
MKNDQTGEYELVVGNPQLLSGFVIVVLLCAAAFVMGYEVGQNTPRSAKAQADTAAPVSTPAPTDTRPPLVTVAPPMETNPTPPADAGQATGDAGKPAEAPPQPTTQPAREVPAAPPPAAPVRQETAAAPPAGAYCQAMAVKQASDAQSLLQTLKDGGMPATLQTSADGLVRVMVGPYQDRAALSRAKTELETRFQIRGPICRQ